jgi:hypothetical protein
MLLSELLASETVPPVVYGIVPDVQNVDPPKGLREAGIIVGVNDNGELDDFGLDLAISYATLGIATTVEVPAEVEADPHYLLPVVGGFNASLSLLPPVNPSDEAFEAYCQRIEAFARAYVSLGNFQKFLVPVTSYLEYMFIEVLSPERAAAFAPSDGHIIESFAKVVTPERADALKARIRAVFHEAFGGEEGFKAFARAMFGAIYDRLEEYCRDEVARLYGDKSMEDRDPPAADVS